MTQENCITPTPETHLYTTITGVAYSLERIGGTRCIGHYYPQAHMGPGYSPADGINGVNALRAIVSGEEQGYPVTLGARGLRIADELHARAVRSAPMDKAQEGRVRELSGLLRNGLGKKDRAEQIEWLTKTLGRTIVSRKQITEVDMRPIRAAVVASRRVLEVNPMARFEAVGV